MILMLLRSFIHTGNTDNFPLIFTVQIQQILMFRTDGLIFIESAQSLNIFTSLHYALLWESIEFIEIQLVVYLLKWVQYTHGLLCFQLSFIVTYCWFRVGVFICMQRSIHWRTCRRSRSWVRDCVACALWTERRWLLLSCRYGWHWSAPEQHDCYC